MHKIKTAFDNRTQFCPKIYINCKVGHLWNIILMPSQTENTYNDEKGNSEGQVITCMKQN